MTRPAIVWLHKDLRLADNSALAEAARAGPVMPVVILDDDPGAAPAGGAAAWWRTKSLHSLRESITRIGGALHILSGDTPSLLAELAGTHQAVGLYWNQGRDPVALALEGRVRERLEAQGVPCHVSPPNSLFPPGSVSKPDGTPYKVYSAFKRAALALPAPSAPSPMPTVDWWHGADDDGGFTDRPQPAWSHGMAAAWAPGEEPAQARMREFLDQDLADYDRNRDRPDLDRTSRLSPHLAHGEISVRRIWEAVSASGKDLSGQFRAELIWREFAHHTLIARPDMPTRELQPTYQRFPWRQDAEALSAWQKGQTGYPIVDAAMRCLWQTGFMHNRLRMVTGSFLVKDLALDWRQGEAWFRDTLVDADIASNTFNWQWVAGCGYDAAPYFRIFNPTTQSRKFDPDGTFIRRYVPELGDLTARDIHQPPVDTLLSPDYPRPIVDHAAARAAALARLTDMRESRD